MGITEPSAWLLQPLARTFAEECLRRFLQGVPIGQAMRAARLALLKLGNPLGLVYIPFALPALHLEARPAATAAGVGCGQAGAVLEPL